MTSTLSPQYGHETPPSGGLSDRFGNLSSLLAPDAGFGVLGGQVVEIDPSAPAAAPMSMTEMVPHPESGDMRVAAELEAAKAILGAADPATLRAIADGKLGAIAPQLAENPGLIAWAAAQAEAQQSTGNTHQAAGAAVVGFTLSNAGRHANSDTRPSYFTARALGRYDKISGKHNYTGQHRAE